MIGSNSIGCYGPGRDDVDGFFVEKEIVPTVEEFLVRIEHEHGETFSPDEVKTGHAIHAFGREDHYSFGQRKTPKSFENWYTVEGCF